MPFPAEATSCSWWYNVLALTTEALWQMDEIVASELRDVDVKHQIQRFESMRVQPEPKIAYDMDTRVLFRTGRGNGRSDVSNHTAILENSVHPADETIGRAEAVQASIPSTQSTRTSSESKQSAEDPRSPTCSSSHVRSLADSDEVQHSNFDSLGSDIGHQKLFVDGLHLAAHKFTLCIHGLEHNGLPPCLDSLKDDLHPHRILSASPKRKPTMRHGPRISPPQNVTVQRNDSLSDRRSAKTPSPDLIPAIPYHDTDSVNSQDSDQSSSARGPSNASPSSTDARFGGSIEDKFPFSNTPSCSGSAADSSFDGDTFVATFSDSLSIMPEPESFFGSRRKYYSNPPPVCRKKASHGEAHNTSGFWWRCRGTPGKIRRFFSGKIVLSVGGEAGRRRSCGN